MSAMPSWDPCLDLDVPICKPVNPQNARPPLPPKPNEPSPTPMPDWRTTVDPGLSSRAKTLNSPKPVYTMAVREKIQALRRQMKPADSVLPSAAQQQLQQNTADKAKDEYVENTFIIDVRSQAEISAHVINGRAFTLIRGGIPFPLALMEKVGEERSAYPEPLCDDPGIKEKEILVSCTDGMTSVLAWNVLKNACGFSNVKVIQGGIQAWAAAKLPLISTTLLDISSDEEEDD
ncbi:hypothetical protein TrVE_jg7083 [Triparma verrucosa]|uniref:Rhodanese domain-containing protein n=1 Tax=Triparma verrucosa TaxID=1606542 RepID=A0A9W7FDB4_9STRA|nr:hypothetical protein TrVE_jg7083 [Triparma verrucosa]